MPLPPSLPPYFAPVDAYRQARMWNQCDFGTPLAKRVQQICPGYPCRLELFEHRPEFPLQLCHIGNGIRGKSGVSFFSLAGSRWMGDHPLIPDQF